jgi:glycogen debranching enzyme
VYVEDAFRIRATASSTAERSRVLKHGELFGLFDQFGDIQSVGEGAQGLYLGNTRHLSRLALLVERAPPLLLSSTVRFDNVVMTTDLTNPDLENARGDRLAGDSIHLRRSKVLLHDTCWESVLLRSFADEAVEIELAFHFYADYADIFEVRGTRRERRGHLEPADLQDDHVTLTYVGLDGTRRSTTLTFSVPPKALEARSARFSFRLELKASTTLTAAIRCEVVGDPGLAIPGGRGPARSFAGALEQVTWELAERGGHFCSVVTTNELFNEWLSRSYVDLHMLTTETSQGSYPYAGIPWFSTAFGRDGLITAFECLWCCPDLAKGVLGYLAHHQAREIEDERDAQPGKILHERRLGEMAALREIPFGAYYGSVDSTPLFVALAGAYYERTGDTVFAGAIWPAVLRSLGWIERFGDADRDGYVEYSRRCGQGLVQQGWKDSGDSVFHRDGSDASAPIALCEVQGYVYAAYQGAAKLADVLGEPERAEALRQRAKELRTRFHRDFWKPELGMYALALDGEKRPCLVRSSNAGQCLWTGIVEPACAEELASQLMSPEVYSGWGVRTLAIREARYNPMAYHNGSVWPHDCAIIAYGLGRYGFKDHAARILADLFDAACHFELHRLPELFCGMARVEGEGPVRYPVACAPQAWAAGAAYLLLQAALGLEVRADHARIVFHRPCLPPCLKHVELRRLRCGEGEVDLMLTRHQADVGVQVVSRRGNVSVTVTK